MLSALPADREIAHFIAGQKLGPCHGPIPSLHRLQYKEIKNCVLDLALFFWGTQGDSLKDVPDNLLLLTPPVLSTSADIIFGCHKSALPPCWMGKNAQD